MAIEPGRDWGEPAVGLNPVLFESDFDLAQAAIQSAGEQIVARLQGGDFLKTLGGPRGLEDEIALPVDVGVVRLEDQSEFGFISNLLVGELFSAKGFWTYMNGTHLDDLVLGAKAHPSDGLIDCVSGSLTWRQRGLAKVRAANGSYLPHPDISYRRASNFSEAVATPHRIHCDGKQVADSRQWSVSLLVDAVIIVV